MKWYLWATTFAIVASWFLSSYIVPLFPLALSSWASFVLLGVYLAVLWLVYPPTRLRLQADRATAVALVVGGVFVAVIYEPVLFVSSIYVPMPPASIGSDLAYYAVFGVFLQSFLFNLNTRGLFDRRRPGVIVLPFALFLLLLVPLATIRSLLIATPQEILSFVIIDVFGGTALFVVLLLLYAKSKFNNLPGVLFYFATAIPTAFAVLFSANLALELAWLFVAYAAVIVLIEVFLPATWVERRLLPATRGPTFTSNRRATFASVAAVAAVLITLLLVVPAVLGTPHPFFADATGSMAPQIEPGSLLIVRHVNVDSIDVGQVLVFTAPWSDGLTVAHEVIAVIHSSAGLEFQTRGIANPGPDPAPVPASAVIGIVALVIPWLGYLIIYSYAVLVATAVGVGAYVAYSISHPRQVRFRHARGLF